MPESDSDYVPPAKDDSSEEEPCIRPDRGLTTLGRDGLDGHYWTNINPRPRRPFNIYWTDDYEQAAKRTRRDGQNRQLLDCKQVYYFWNHTVVNNWPQHVQAYWRDKWFECMRGIGHVWQVPDHELPQEPGDFDPDSMDWEAPPAVTLPPYQDGMSEMIANGLLKPDELMEFVDTLEGQEFKTWRGRKILVEKGRIDAEDWPLFPTGQRYPATNRGHPCYPELNDWMDCLETIPEGGTDAPCRPLRDKLEACYTRQMHGSLADGGGSGDDGPLHLGPDDTDNGTGNVLQDKLKDCYKKAEDNYWDLIKDCKDTWAKEAATQVMCCYQKCLDVQKEAQKEVDLLTAKDGYENCHFKVIRTECKDKLPPRCREPSCPDIDLDEPPTMKRRKYSPDIPGCPTLTCEGSRRPLPFSQRRPGARRRFASSQQPFSQRFPGARRHYAGVHYAGAPARGPPVCRRRYADLQPNDPFPSGIFPNVPGGVQLDEFGLPIRPPPGGL